METGCNYEGPGAQFGRDALFVFLRDLSNKVIVLKCR